MPSPLTENVPPVNRTSPALSTLPAGTLTSLICADSAAVRPGAKVPPLTFSAPSVPTPPSVPPVTVVGLVCEPLTDSLPPATVVSPDQVLAPVRNRVPLPDFVRLPL